MNTDVRKEQALNKCCCQTYHFYTQKAKSTIFYAIIIRSQESLVNIRVKISFVKKKKNLICIMT